MLSASLCIIVILLTPVLSAQSMRGLIVTKSGAVWASGSNATILRTTDGQQPFRHCSPPPDSTGLDFRGIYAWDADRAIVMSAGPGKLSRLYETHDACATWHLLFANPDPQGFWDTVVFSSKHPDQGVLLGDPVDGRFTIFRTGDAGHHWVRDTTSALASNPKGEGAFAASNSSLVILNDSGDLLFGTGGVGGPRIFRFDASIKEWSSVVIPTQSKNESAGIFSLACRSATECMAVGGDYKHPENRQGTAFLSKDAGRSWSPPPALPGGYRSAVSWSKAWIVAGPTGAEAILDNQTYWISLGTGNWNALSGIWAAGPNGRVEPLAKAIVGVLSLPDSTHSAKPQSGR